MDMCGNRTLSHHIVGRCETFIYDKFQIDYPLNSHSSSQYIYILFKSRKYLLLKESYCKGQKWPSIKEKVLEFPQKSKCKSIKK